MHDIREIACIRYREPVMPNGEYEAAYSLHGSAKFMLCAPTAAREARRFLRWAKFNGVLCVAV